MHSTLQVRGSRRTRNFVKENTELFDGNSLVLVSVKDAIGIIGKYCSVSAAKFDESIDIAVHLGVDPQRPEHMIKTSAVLPHGNGKQVKLLVFADGEVAKEALSLGASIVGIEEIIEAVIAGQIVPGKDFNSCIATTEAMVKLAKSQAARIIGQAGLIPNAKVGTVAKDIIPIVKEVMSGRIILKQDKASHMRFSIGRVSFGDEKIYANLVSVYNAIKAAKPASFKGVLFKSIKLSTTMSPFSVAIKLSDLYDNNG